jgi:ATP-dependent DNA ligase
LRRKKHLSHIISNGPTIMLPTFVVGDGQALFDWSLLNKWEGIVAKHISSRYRINRRPDRLVESWIKRKHTETTEAFILGYQVNPFALVVGLESLVPAALVEFGFNSEEKIAFRRIAKQIHIKTSKW